MRLSDRVRPTNYRLELVVDPIQDDFTGRVEIDVEVLDAQADIRLNACQLEVEGATRIDADTICVSGPFAAGPATLKLRFQGRLNPRLRGLYRSRDASGRPVLVSQGEPNYARQIFPCFDEPRWKARFELSVEIPEGLVALSNAPELRREPVGAGRCRVRFAPTPRMSCYLLALVVGELESSPPREVDGVCIRVWATPGRGQLLDYSLDLAARVLPEYRRYFGCPYPLNKLDLIGVPDFGSGAMENLGAVIFRETYLLTDPAGATRQALCDLSETVAHEIAHMWFGDLVTMAWWDDLWLNEAFATWMMVRAVDGLHPDWRVWDAFSGNRQRALELDGLLATRPIYAQVDSPDQMAEMFDLITYNKGASVIKMLEEFLGAELFRQGVSLYIQRHQFDNASGDDLWQALEEVSSHPVRRLMEAWLTQPGYPLLRLEQSAEGVLIHQSRFTYSGTAEGQWPVPLVYRVGSETRRLLLTGPSAALAQPGETVVLNAGGFGYFRCQGGNRRHTDLSPAERVNLWQDEWALVLAGRGSLDELVALARDWAPHESEFLVWDAILATFTELARVDDRGTRELAKELIPRSSTGEERLQARLRGARASLAGDTDQLGWARQALERSDQGEWHTAALEIVGAHGDIGDFQRVVELWRAATEPEVARRLLLSLGGFHRSECLQLALQMVLEAQVRPQDGGHLILAACHNPAAAGTVWNFMHTHWEGLVKVLPMQGMRLFLQGLPSLVLPEQLETMRTFLQAHPVEGGRRQLIQGLERLEVMLALRDRIANVVKAG